MALHIPNKPLGARYKVIMYDPNLSPHAVAMGLIRGGTAPLPAMPPRCVCCDAATEQGKRMNLSTDRLNVTPIVVPVCDACQDHAFAQTLGTYLIAFALTMVIAVLVIAIALASAFGIVITSLLALGLAGVAMLQARARRARARDGHHAIAMAVTPGKTVVITSNRRLLDDLIELNRKTVHYVT